MEPQTLTAATVTGALLPLVIAVAQQRKWSDATRAYVALGVAVAAGLAVAVTNGAKDPTSLVGAVLTTVIATQATHQGLWKPTGVTKRVEKRTTPPDVTKVARLSDPEYRDYLRRRDHD